MQDVLVVGGGVIGLSAAYELARHGVRVTLLDQSAIGREASWAGAGMLPPSDLSGVASMRALADYSYSLWPKLTADLRSETGIDNGFLRCGAIQVSISPGQNLAAECGRWQRIGVEAHLLDRARMHESEPEMNPEFDTGYRLPTMAQIRNPWHLKALRTACLARGVRFRPGQPVVAWTRNGEWITAARTPTDEFTAAKFLVTAGAWTSGLIRSAGADAEIQPVRGQILLLRVDRLPFRHIIECGPRYLVPRSDGRILIGSTEEQAGFVKENTAEGIRGLLDFAVRLVPRLKRARFEKAWSGLRPCPLRGRPFIGPVSNSENLFVAAGHFRSGLSNSPGTARIIHDLLTGATPAIDVADFG